MGDSQPDYIKDGILYCGICGTPRQKYIEFNGQKGKVGILCKCREDAEDAREFAYADSIRRAKIEANRRRLGARADRSTFESDDGRNGPAMEVVRSYSEKFKDIRGEKVSGLILWGEPRQGKTFAAECLANRLIGQGLHVEMDTAANYVQMMQWGGADRVKEAKRGLCHCDLLIIDDIGAERGTDFGHEVVMGIVDDRCVAGLPIVATTNLTLAQMRDGSDLHRMRLYGRILERCLPVRFDRVRDPVDNEALKAAYETLGGTR